MWRFVFALVLLICGSGAALAQSSAPHKQTSETTAELEISPDEFSKRDCQRLDFLLEAMNDRSPEIQFCVSKIAPNGNMNFEKLARAFILGAPAARQAADEESVSKEFWNKLFRSRRAYCTVGGGTLLKEGAQAYSFVSEIQKRFPKQQRLNPQEVAMLMSMCCYKAERLAVMYKDFRGFLTGTRELSEKEVVDCRNQAANVRRQLIDCTGAAAVAMSVADLHEELDQRMFKESVDLTQERAFIQASSKALIKNSPEINFFLTKLLPDHIGRSLCRRYFCGAILRWVGRRCSELTT